MNMTKDELDLIISVFWNFVLLAVFLGLFLSSFLYSIYKVSIRFFNIPKFIKTEKGILYRADNGFYVEKKLLESLNADYLFRNKQRSLEYHKRQVARLELEVNKRVSTSD